MSTVILENEVCLAEISTQAAEVHRLFDKTTGIEYAWCGNPEHWANRNPILFPHIGGVPDKKYVLNGKEYTTGNHGFARHSEFVWGEVTETSAELILASSDELKEKEYPFDFELRVKYTLTDKHLDITYTVVNKDDKELPFEIGMHPAFNIPMSEDKKFEDYYVLFEAEEDAVAKGRESIYELKGKLLPFKENPFEKSKAIFFSNLNSKWVIMTDGTHGIKVGNEGMERTGFWRPTSVAPFVCIEPQMPKNTLKRADTFSRGKDNWLLGVNESFTFNYYFEIAEMK